jgi:hypothetical protein
MHTQTGVPDKARLAQMCKTRAPAGGTLDDFCMRLAQSEDDEVLILMAKALNIAPEKLEQYSPQQYDFWQPGGSGSGLDSDSISAYSDHSDEQEYYAEEDAAALVHQAVSAHSADHGSSAAVAVATVVNGGTATTATALTSVSSAPINGVDGAADSGYANLISDAIELLPLDTDGASQAATTAAETAAVKKPKFGAGKGFTPQSNTDVNGSNSSSGSKHSQRIRSQANFIKFGSGSSSSSSVGSSDMALPPPPLPPQSSSSSSSSTVDAPVNGVSLLQEVAVAAAAAAGLAVPSAAVHSSAVTAASAAAAVAAAAAAYEPAQPMFADPQMLCPHCMPVRGMLCALAAATAVCVEDILSLSATAVYWCAAY